VPSTVVSWSIDARAIFSPAEKLYSPFFEPLPPPQLRLCSGADLAFPFPSLGGWIFPGRLLPPLFCRLYSQGDQYTFSGTWVVLHLLLPCSSIPKSMFEYPFSFVCSPTFGPSISSLVLRCFVCLLFLKITFSILALGQRRDPLFTSFYSLCCPDSHFKSFLPHSFSEPMTEPSPGYCARNLF